MRASTVATLAILATAASVEAGAVIPACAEGGAGLVACVAGKLCACRFDRGGTSTGLPAGYRWDCGVLRPACGDAADPPATPDRYPFPLPPALGIDRPPRGTHRR
jgi:hypothetical protein